MRTVIFGVDGLTFLVLHPLMARGELPHFRRLRQEGYEAVLESKYPPLTPPAWISLFTGLKPARHGVYDYWSFEEQGSGLPPKACVNTRRKGGKAIWNILSECGKRVLIINVPMTYPPEPVNGAMVSGYMTPDDSADYTYPLSLRDELRHLVPEYTIDLDLRSVFNGKPRAEPLRLIEATLHMTRQRMKLLAHLLKEQPWDFCFTAFVGADRLQHPLWDDITACDTMAIEYYRLLDECLGLVLAQLGPDDRLFVVSDHGFQGVDRSFAINEYLYSKNLLALDARLRRERASAMHMNNFKHLLRRTHLFPLAHSIKVALKEGGMLRVPLADVAQPVPLGIDWERTLASVPSYSCFPGGYADVFLQPDLDSDLIAILCEDLGRQVDPVSHRPLLASISASEVFGTGPYAREEPHLLLLPNDGITFSTHLGNERFWEDARMDNDCKKRCGVHHKDGVLYAYGSGIKRNCQGSMAEIYDVVPTVLYSMNIASSETYDGRVLHEMFVQGAVANIADENGAGIVRRKLRKLQREGAVKCDGDAIQ